MQVAESYSEGYLPVLLLRELLVPPSINHSIILKSRKKNTLCEGALSPKETEKTNSGYIYFILIQPGLGFSFMGLARLLRGGALCELVDLNTFRRA